MRHLKLGLPKSYKLSVSGIRSLLIAALITTVSLSESPIIILPPIVTFPTALILPVTPKLPVTLVFATNSIVPVPFGRNSIAALETNVEIVF